MVVTKDKPEYTEFDPDFAPGPKHGHLSNLDPDFAAAKPVVDPMIESIWEPSLSLDEFRKMWLNEGPPPPGCPVEGQDVITATMKIPMRDGYEVEVKTYSPKEKKEGSVLMMRFHGGGWVVGGHCTEHSESLGIAGRTNTVVVSVDYRMAPEFKFPYAVNDCFDALKWSKNNAASLGVDPNKIILNGGSAGCNLASVVAILARDEGVTGIVSQMLNFPVTVHPKFAPRDKYEMKSWQQNADASVVNAVRLEWFVDQYMPEPSDDWRFSPLLAPSLKNLPPTCKCLFEVLGGFADIFAVMTVAGYDPLRDEGLAYAERLEAEGNDIELHTYQGLPHCFYMLNTHPKTLEYYETIVAFVKKYSG